MKLELKQTRPSMDVDFFSDASFAAYLREQYIDTGKLEMTVSIDGLTRTVVFSGTAAVLNQLKADPVVKAAKAARLAYNATHGIV